MLLDKDSIGAGESAFVQLRFDEPLAVKRTDPVYHPVLFSSGDLWRRHHPGRLSWKAQAPSGGAYQCPGHRETGTDEEVLELVLKEESIRFPSVHRAGSQAQLDG